MEINEKYIKATGKSAIDETLKHGDDITVTLSITEISEKNREDGTVDVVYKGKLFAPTDQGQPVTLTPSKKSRSAYHRWLLEQLWEKEYKNKKTFQEFYNQYYDRLDDKVLELLNN